MRQPMRIIFLLTNSSAPRRPISRPVPDQLDAAEGQLAIGEDERHEHHARLDLVGHALRASELSGAGER